MPPPIDENTVKKVARLARLQLTEEELTSYAKALRGILKHVDAIEKLDLANVPATSHAVQLTAPMRADETRPSLKDPLQNAPYKEGTSFKVPKIIE